MICENCGKEHNGEYGSGRFCSKSCAKSYSTKNIIDKFKKAKCIICGKQIYINKRASNKKCKCEDCKYQIYNCIVCGNIIKGDGHRTTCSEKCHQIYLKNRKLYLSNDALIKLSNAGKKSANIQSEIRRSKNEIAFYELCEKYFQNIEHNKPIFNGWDADVIIHDIKYAILWNGKWHYKKITKSHSVEQVQNRDKIKIREIENAGYKPYIIKDMGQYNLDFVKDEFNKFLNIAV